MAKVSLVDQHRESLAALGKNLTHVAESIDNGRIGSHMASIAEDARLEALKLYNAIAVEHQTEDGVIKSRLRKNLPLDEAIISDALSKVLVMSAQLLGVHATNNNGHLKKPLLECAEKLSSRVAATTTDIGDPDLIPSLKNGEVAESLKIEPGTVSHLVTDGILISNGKKGKQCLITRQSVEKYRNSDSYRASRDKLARKPAQAPRPVQAAASTQRPPKASTKTIFVECIDCGNFVTAVNGVCPQGGNHRLKPIKAKAS